jgi:hypothetical protein
MKYSCIHAILYGIAISVGIAALLGTFFLYQELKTDATHFQGEHIPLSRKFRNETGAIRNETKIAASRGNKINTTTQAPTTTTKKPAWYHVDVFNATGTSVYKVNWYILTSIVQDWNYHYPTSKLDKPTAFKIYHSIRRNETSPEFLQTQFLSKDTLRKIRSDKTLTYIYFPNQTEPLVRAGSSS